ncbi:MAG: site-2 protease family protein [Anaerolineae bacterium]|jgi:Zn-dependent protease|nr:site-2 protease family protein [Anaerolineae bacterium]
MFGLTSDVVLARLIVVMLGIPIHEWSHCWVASLLGDTTGEAEGRLSLNPFVHLDPLGTILILLTGFGWGRPAPVNPYRMHRVSNPRLGMALSALAGPFSNFIQAIVLALILRFVVAPMPSSSQVDWAIKILIMAISVNIGLVAFNMIPVPPLDGSRVLAGVAPPNIADFIEQLEPIAPYLLMAVLFVLPQLGIDLVSWMATPLYRILFSLLLW